MRISLVALLLMAFGSAAVSAGQVQEYTLDNGMKVIVKEDHRAPVVVSQVWYRVGSSYESGGITGLSHMLEHMMFKGTENYGEGEFSRIVADEGGSDNAFTGRDYTAYYQRLAADRLEVSLRLEADRMRGLLLKEEAFEKERQVVAEERRLRTEDRSQSLTYEQFRAVAFQASPYGQPIIGWMSDIEGYELGDLRDWYRRWYAPNNAILVVVGDVDPVQVRERAEHHFGRLDQAEVGPPKPRDEPPQRGERRLMVKAPARLPYLVMGYKTPSLETADPEWEAYALEVLAALLDGGDSARLPSRLVRGQELAASVSADFDPYTRLPELFTVTAVPADGRSISELESAIRAELEELRTKPVTEAELERVKTQVAAADVYQRDSVFYQAMRIGILESVGLGWRTDLRYLEGIRAIEAEQVRQVARKYLVDDALTVAVLDPQPMESPAVESGNKGVSRHVD